MIGAASATTMIGAVSKAQAVQPWVLCLDACGDRALMVIAGLEAHTAALTSSTSSPPPSSLPSAACSVIAWTTIPAAPSVAHTRDTDRDNDRVGVLLDALLSLRQQHPLEWSGLRAGLVVAGPGRYTGMRLGMAMMRGLTTPDIPLLAVRRDHAYANLLHGAGLMLMESGKATAFIAASPFDTLPQLGNATDALQQLERLQTCSVRAPVQLCSLLPAESLAAHYSALHDRVLDATPIDHDTSPALIFPNAATQATALARLVCWSTNGQIWCDVALPPAKSDLFYGVAPVA